MKTTLPLFMAVIVLGFVARDDFGLFLSGAASAPRQTLGKRAPIRAISSIDGKDLYKEYCEQCHGAGGKGDGPAARGLKSVPTDLTTIAKGRGGVFSRNAVEAFIRGDRPGGVTRLDRGTGAPVVIKADGTPDEMPVYGSLFRKLWPDQPVTVRTSNLAKYIESLQVK